MNKYKLAETIVTKILDDLKTRMDSGTKWDIGDQDIQTEIADKWEDIVIAEIEKGQQANLG